MEASGARSLIVSAPEAGEAVAAEGLKGAAEAKPVAACASAAGRCASASADESCPEVECAVGVVREKSLNLWRVYGCGRAASAARNRAVFSARVSATGAPPIDGCAVDVCESIIAADAETEGGASSSCDDGNEAFCGRSKAGNVPPAARRMAARSFSM